MFAKMGNMSRRRHAPGQERGPFSENLMSLIAATLHPSAPHVLHSPEVIKAILHRECARCERSGSEFCLVVIDPGAAPLAQKQLADVLLGDSRRADEVGMLDDRHLCVFLPYTAPAGADRYVARFTKRTETIGWKPTVQVFVYPSENPQDREPREDRRETKPGHRKSGGKVPAVAGVEQFLTRQMPFWKRATDIAFAGSALLVLWPVMLLIALVVKLTSKGPIFFAQWRMGLGGRPFRIFKFRTMVPNAAELKKQMLQHNEQDGPAFKMARDPRITRVGRILRTTSLDELPQLLNILKGDMSLVGPRPLELDETAACHPWQKRRLDVVPGLTCTWQISGRGTVSFADWARMDRNYIRRQSFFHDVKLLAMTVPAVLARRGAM